MHVTGGCGMANAAWRQAPSISLATSRLDLESKPMGRSHGTPCTDVLTLIPCNVNAHFQKNVSVIIYIVLLRQQRMHRPHAHSVMQ